MSPSTPESIWQLLAEFSLPGKLSNERLVSAKLAEAVQGLNLPVTALERLKIAVGRTMLNAIEHGSEYQFETPTLIRILISDKAYPLYIVDQTSEGLLPKPETPDLAANLADEQSLPGWGFFLIEKGVDNPRLRGNEAHHTIELFLYLEGGSFDPVSPPSPV